MGKASKYFPPVGTYHHKWYPDEVVSLSDPLSGGRVWYVDGDKTASGAGRSWSDAYDTIQEAVTAASAGDVIYIAEKTITALATDPVSYAETIIIPNAKSSLSLIGVSRGRTQGGLPQIKIGSGSTAMLTVRAPGCLIANIGINGIDSTGGGVLLDDDGGTSKVAFGTSIVNCHFKNCVGSTATNAATGGAIMWTSSGNAWQIHVQGNRFYKNVGDIVMPGTGSSIPQDVVIEDNIFSGPAANVDCNIYTAGDGISGLVIRNNEFPAMPALGSGSNLRFVKLTGSVGIMTGNSFATSTTLTFGAAGTGGIVPTTMFMPKNYRETTTGVSSEIFRT